MTTLFDENTGRINVEDEAMGHARTRAAELNSRTALAA